MTERGAHHPITILVADDDPDDRQMAEEALRAARLANDLHFVADGEELLAYLQRTGPFVDPASSPRPGIVLLDLNMPRVDGREALEAIKGDPGLRQIPVVVLTTSRTEEDIYRSYDLGVSGYVAKPITFDGLVDVMHRLGRYWLQLVELPSEDWAGSRPRPTRRPEDRNLGRESGLSIPASRLTCGLPGHGYAVHT